MLIRNHVCTAKRFFQRALESFKSYLSRGEDSSYQKLPKNTRRIIKEACQESHRMHSGSYKETWDGRRLKLGVEKGKKAADQHQEAELCKRELRMRAVAKRLKEMEMVDKSNVHHLLDIEEVFHYYSRLTCPAFLEIVDQFFMELQAEFMGADQSLNFLQGDT